MIATILIKVLIKRLNLFLVGATLKKFNIKYGIAILIDYIVWSKNVR